MFIEEIRAAYEKTGLKPSPKTTIKDGCACPLGAMAFTRRPFTLNCNDNPPLWEIVYLLGFDEARCYKFANGFDGSECNQDSPAYRLGQLVRMELLGEGK